MAYQPDPEAFAIDAFTLSWVSFFALRPFSLIALALLKIQEAAATGLVLAHKWPTQPWWQTLVRSNISNKSVSVSSGVQNTEKQMKARGRRPSAFNCFEVFGTPGEIRSTNCLYDFANETIRMYSVSHIWHFLFKVLSYK